MCLLDCLIEISETAAGIAQGIRSDKKLLAKLTEEKSCVSKNERFNQDFKTLADVLIQEIARFRISSLYPELTEQIFGEETSTIAVSGGSSMTITLSDDVQSTRNTLLTATEGDTSVTDALVDLIHKKKKELRESGWSRSLSQEDLKDVGIWIDPIDGTNVYVCATDNPSKSDSATEEIVEKGLENVTVLLGGFSLSTGLPNYGVIHQPFASFDEVTEKWTTRLYYGALCSCESVLSDNVLPQEKDIPTDYTLQIMLSSADPLLQTLNHYQNHSNVGGGVLDYRRFWKLRNTFLAASSEERKKILEDCEVRYKKKKMGSDYCNNGGVLAYRHTDTLEKFCMLQLPDSTDAN